LGILAIVVVAVLVPRVEPGNQERIGMVGSLKTVLTNPVALVALAAGLSFSLANEVVNLVFGVWMEEAFNLRLASLGYIAAVIGFSELGGEVLVAMFVDRIGKPRVVTIGLVMNSLAALALAWLGRSMVGAAVGLFFFYISFEFTLVSLIPLMSEILPAARATLLAANVSALALGRAFGALIALPLFRWGEASGVLPGILVCGLVSVLFNCLALGIFSNLKRHISHL
jgi:predicted MFS family arabinose efflux permease